VVDGKYGRKDIRVVAVLADVCCLNVSKVFANSVGTVVAVDAATRDVDMVKIRRQPANRRMTIVAIFSAGYVVGIFPGCRQAIMTGATCPGYLYMVYGVDRRKCVGVVAVLADVGGLDVCQILAGRIRTVVTAGTVVSDVYVVEIRWYPAKR